MAPRRLVVMHANRRGRVREGEVLQEDKQEIREERMDEVEGVEV